MAKRSLRPQLNQIRAWVRQGRTDAWIAHQLEIGTAELREFRRQHGLSADDDDSSAEIDLRDEIEAEIAESTEEEDDEEDEEDAADEDVEGEGDRDGDAEPDDSDAETESDGAEAEGRPRRRRRRGRRGGRGRRKTELEAVFDHGEKDGFGLWLDPAVQDDPAYAEHWAGRREVTVKVEQDQIVIRRAGAPSGDDADDED